MQLQYPDCLNTIKLEVVGKFTTSSDHHDIRCLLCSSIFNATPKSKMSNNKKTGMIGCPKCTMDFRFKQEKDNIRQSMIDLGFEIDGDYRSKHDNITVRNTNCICGRWWNTKPEYLKSGRSFCRPCNDDRKRNRFTELNAEREIAYDGTIKTYKTIVTKLTSRTYNKHKISINPNNYPRVRSDKAGHQLDHIVPIVICHRMGIPAELCASVDNLRLIPRMDNAKKWSKPTESIPTKLLQYFGDVVTLNNTFAEFLIDTNITYKTNQIIDGYAFNFVIEDICVLLCSFDMFKEQSLKSRKFLSNVREVAMAQNYRPIFLFESEINDNRAFDIVKSRILNMLGKSPGRIYARKCIIREVATSIKTKFLEDNHMQGAVGSALNYGLWYNDELVALATFSNKRHFMSNTTHDKDDYELLRYVTKKYINVVGGASRLIKYFILQQTPKSLISFSDNRWGSGNVYKSIGMELTHSTPPNYWYIVNSKLHYRYKYKKHTLAKQVDIFDGSKSEYQNMLINGYDRIWDCGSNAYKYTLL